jgi:hypothetical protein
MLTGCCTTVLAFGQSCAVSELNPELESFVGFRVFIRIQWSRKQLVNRRTTYLLGQVDVLPFGGFDSSASAMALGPTRLARGRRQASTLVDKDRLECQIIRASSTNIMHPRRLGKVTLVLAASVALSCSSDSIAGPGRRTPAATFTLELTSVSGKRIPAVYYSDPIQVYRSWADSATATRQSDGVIAFHLYESGTSPLDAPHEDQPSQTYFASGILTSDSTFAIYYSDSPTPDRGTISANGSVTVEFTGIDDRGQSVSFGTWVFASAYRGPPLNPAPHISGVDPAIVLVSNTDATLTINGSSFTPGSVVSVDAQQLQSVLVSSTQLQVDLPPQLVSSPRTFNILVTNPGPGGGTYYYPVKVGRAAPTIAAISPNTVSAGAEIYSIAITGTGFDQGTMVSLNGILRGATGTTSPTRVSVPIDPLDVAGPGVIQIAVVNPPPGGGTSTTLPFTVTPAARQLAAEIITPTSATVLAGDPIRSVVYAGEDRSDPVNPNSIVALDGATGRVLWSVPAGGTPSMLAVSDDGQFLYFNSAPDSAVRRITLATATVDLTIPMTKRPQCSPHAYYGVVVPGSAHTLALEQSCLPGVQSGGNGVAIYDDSVMRPQVASDANYPTLGPLVSGASATAFYTYISGQVHDITVDASGATASPPHFVYGPTLNTEIAYLNGIVYSLGGPLYNPATGSQAVRSTWFPSTLYSIAPGRDGKTLYAITDRLTLDALDVSADTLVGSVAVPGPEAPRQHLVRWGTDGVAFIGGQSDRGGNVYLVRSDLVH